MIQQNYSSKKIKQQKIVQQLMEQHVVHNTQPFNISEQQLDDCTRLQYIHNFCVYTHVGQSYECIQHPV